MLLNTLQAQDSPMRNNDPAQDVSVLRLRNPSRCQNYLEKSTRIHNCLFYVSGSRGRRKGRGVLELQGHIAGRRFGKILVVSSTSSLLHRTQLLASKDKL